MEWGLPDAAQSIYSLYHPCHQLAFRSLFSGEQAFYPRELANIEGADDYGEVTVCMRKTLLWLQLSLAAQKWGIKWRSASGIWRFSHPQPQFLR